MYLGLFFALVIGFTLGMIGGGGSMLAVPVLVYIIGVNPVLATAYSLFIVGVSSFVGGIKYAQNGAVDYKTIWTFGLPSIITVFFTRYYLVPKLPEVLLQFQEFQLTKDFAIMFLFGLLMLFAAFSMIRSQPIKDKKPILGSNYHLPLIILEGILVGGLTGIVGAGGGFLIIPALVLLTKIPMKKAIGTSLFIIALKSMIGFLGDVGHQTIEWHFLIPFTLLAIIGILFGSKQSKKIPSKLLKKGFGYFTLFIGALIVALEIYYSLH